MNKNKLCLLIISMFFFFNLSIGSSQTTSGYHAPLNSTTQWEVIQDNAVLFAFISVGDTITGTVYEENTQSILVYLDAGNSFIEAETIFIYNNLTCFPFFIQLEYLFDPNLVIENIIKNYNGIDRNVTTILLTNLLDQNITMTVSYDTYTGIMIQMIANDTFNRQSIIGFETTDAWIPPTPPKNPVLISFIIAIISIAGVFGLITLVYWLRKKQKLKNLE